MAGGHGPRQREKPLKPGDGSFEVDTADPTSRLPPSEVDSGLLVGGPVARSVPHPGDQPVGAQWCTS